MNALKRQRPYKLKPAKLPRLTEAQFTRQIKDLLAFRGYVLIRNHVGKFVPYRVAMECLERLSRGIAMEAVLRHLRANVIAEAEEGTADWVAVHPIKRTIWIELKRPGEKPRPNQVHWLEYMIQVRQFLGGWWDSIDEFRAWFAGLSQ
jgi:hypothetical protein